MYPSCCRKLTLNNFLGWYVAWVRVVDGMLPFAVSLWSVFHSGILRRRLRWQTPRRAPTPPHHTSPPQRALGRREKHWRRRKLSRKNRHVFKCACFRKSRAVISDLYLLWASSERQDLLEKGNDLIEIPFPPFRRHWNSNRTWQRRSKRC